ncbi:MAG: leucine-rich repeat domain-containing protein [Clostridia bacterium]|nr:leucine-rich repeat domain-containing protein [Clostridia bacterium]
MKKKLLLAIFALVCALCCAFGLAACGEENKPDNKPDKVTPSDTNELSVAGNTYIFSELSFDVEPETAKEYELYLDVLKADMQKSMDGTILWFYKDGKFSTANADGETQNGVYTQAGKQVSVTIDGKPVEMTATKNSVTRSYLLPLENRLPSDKTPKNDGITVLIVFIKTENVTPNVKPKPNEPVKPSEPTDTACTHKSLYRVQDNKAASCSQEGYNLDIYVCINNVDHNGKQGICGAVFANKSETSTPIAQLGYMTEYEFKTIIELGDLRNKFAKFYTVVSTTPHTPVIDEAVKATCSQKGLTEGSHCDVCKTVLKAQVETNFADHDYSHELVYSKTMYKVCSICGNIQGTDNVLKMSLNSDENSYMIEKGTVSSETVDFSNYQSYNGKPITAIGREAYRDNTLLKSVIIGGAISRVEQMAFRGCSSLTDIVIEDSVKEVGYCAFYECDQIEKISLPCKITLQSSPASSRIWNTIDNLFKVVYSGGYTEGSIPKTLKTVEVTGSGTITWETYDCTNIESAILHEGVTAIGERAFYNCSSLTSVTIPSSVANIGSEAFAYCSSLKSITIPDNVTRVSSSAFDECPIESATIPAIACSAIKNSALKNVVITSGSEIGREAFNDCGLLTDVTIPGSVTEIGDDAFKGCTSLESITVSGENGKYHSEGNCLIETETKTLLLGCKTSIIPADGSVEIIDSYAFNNCNALETIIIPDSISNIGAAAFSGCTSLASITVPFVGANKDGTGSTYFGHIFSTSPYNSSAYVPASLKTVVITGGEAIGSSAFSGCASLANVSMGDSVTSIGDSAFYNCTALASITIGNGVTDIGDYAFENCNALADIIYTGDISGWCGISNLGELMSYGAENKTLTIDGEEITDSLTITDGVTDITSYAFYHCTALTSVTVGDDIASIGNYAFEGCSSLESITLGSSVTEIGNHAFEGCTSLTSITFTGDIGGWCGISGLGGLMRYGASNKTLTIGENEITDTLIIPDNLNSISSYAFYHCSLLTTITIPASVISIGNYAFEGCSIENATVSTWVIDYIKSSALKTVTITGGSNIGYKAFEGCTSLTSVTISSSSTTVDATAFVDCPIENATIPATAISYIKNPALKTVTVTSGSSIDANAFESCELLTSVTLPYGLRRIGNGAFYLCGSLETISIPDSVTSIDSNAFTACRSLKNITIPDSVTSIGTNVFRGCSSLTSVSLPDGIKSISSDMFAFCTSLTSITIPDHVTSIGDYAFENCELLTSITLPAGVTSIGSAAFVRCSSLTSIVIPDGVTTVKANAFAGCSALTSITLPAGVTSIGESAFYGCSSLTSIIFKGTEAQWEAIQKSKDWNTNTGNYTVDCTGEDTATEN